MLPNNQQITQTKPREPERALDPIVLGQLREAIADPTPILQAALHEIPKRRTDLYQAVVTENDVQVGKGAHFIAGCAANVGAMKLSGLARTLETMAHNDDLSTAGTILAELAQEAERVVATLRTLLADERQVAPRTDTSQ